MSIRARLLLLVAVATLLPTLFLGLRFVADREREIASAIAGLMTDANDLALAVDEKILGTVQLHYGLSRARDLDTEDRVACSRFLSAVREEYPQYTGILTIRPDGRLFCDSLATGRNLDLRDRRYFREAVGPGAGVALEPVFGRLTGTSVLQIAYPVRTPDGTLRHVLLASLNLERLLQSRAKPGLEFLLVAQDGTVLAWLPADQRGSRKEVRSRASRSSPLRKPMPRAAPARSRASTEPARSGPRRASVPHTPPGCISWSVHPASA